MSLKMLPSIVKKSTLLLLASALVLSTSCAHSNEKNTPTPTATSDAQSQPIKEELPENAAATTPSSDLSALVANVKDKYASATSYKFDDHVYILERNEVLKLELPFAITNDHNTATFFQFFLDPELTIPLSRPLADDYYTGDNKIKLHPQDYPFFRTEFEDEAVRGKDANWGNAGTLYLAKYYDRQGNVLDEPQEVSILKIKAELAQPQVNVSCDENGQAMLSWQSVPGATQYGIYSFFISENKISGDEILMSHGTTTDTYYKGFDVFTHDTSNITGRDTNGVITINQDFCLNKETLTHGFVVIAENANGKSEMSKVINPNDYSYMLPYSIDYDAVDDLATDNKSNLPYFYPVEMCDYSTINYPLIYDVESMQENGDKTSTGKSIVSIIAKPEGTPFERVFYFSYDPAKETKEAFINNFLEKQQAAISHPSGLNDLTEINVVTSDEELPTPDPSTAVMIDPDTIFVTATNRLSEYLAYNFLSCNTDIPLDDFPEASDTDYLIDAYREVKYQNPLIDNIVDININPYTGHLVMTYSRDYEEQSQRQKQVLDKAAEIVNSIITTDMSNLEKEMALNQYLCEKFTYDHDALDNAAMHNYKYVDPEFDDSFTAYGGLINNLCVCQGYAQAFKLLADYADLDSIVVTGYLGGVGHAWNKVNIDDNWFTLDVTNNDNEVFSNALFNLPDDFASLYLVEDKDFILDPYYSSVCGSVDTDYEFYHLTDNYYNLDELPKIIADKLEEPEPSFVIRTDFDCPDEELYDLVLYTYEQYHPNCDINFNSWYGVIRINKLEDSE